mgnify:CR=1 FL=1
MPDRSRPGTPTTALSIDEHQDGSDKCVTGAQDKKTFKLPSENITIGTWNVRTLYACGKVKELEHELQRYQWDIIGLSEVRWTGFGESVTDDGHKIWFSGRETVHEHGVAFIVRKEAVGCILSCTPISSRIISIRVSARPKNITIFQVYAPTTAHDDEEVEEFYEELENSIKKVPKKDLLIVQGDFNAKVGRDAYEQWAGTVGQYGTGETNDRGLRLLEFAESHQLTLATTLYPHKLSRRTTWHAPSGKIHNQIDYILTPRRIKSSINRAKTRTYPGADVGSDHDLVLLNMKMKLKKKYQAARTRIKFDLEKLRDPEVAEVFQAQLGGRFAALNILNNDINDLTNSFNEAVRVTAEEVLGLERKKHKPWTSNDILDLCDKRRSLKKTKHSTPQDAAQYRETNNLVRKKMREAKEQWINEQCENIEAGMTKGNSKHAYDTLKKLTKAQQNKSSVIEDCSGNLLTENSAVLKRWSQYCSDLYNHPLQPDHSLIDGDSTPQREPSPLPVLKEEVEEAIRSLPTGKSPGADNIPAELLKNGGEHLATVITSLCQKIWATKQWPVEWTQSLIIPLPKKGNLRQCQNYRTISLISHTSKIMLRVILNRLKKEAEEHLAEEQAGFRAGRSTVEQIFSCRILMEKHLQHQRDLLHNFIDFKKAFDRVWHAGLWQVLRKFGIEEGLIQIIEALYNTSSSAVLLNGQVGDYFKTSVGVRQGCLLSPTLFNLFLENIMRETLYDFHSTISIGGRPINNLRFADDIDLMGGSNKELQNLTNRLVDRADAYGMEVSTEKSKVLVNSANDTTAQIYMNGQQLEEVDAFKYLGATLTKDGRSTTEIKTRLAMATSAMTKLNKIWRSNDISFKTKVKLFRSLVISILLYGCESWTMTAETTKRIQTFETKCFRRLLGISWKDRKTNTYVRSQVALLAGPQEPLLATVKKRKLAWFGHVTRHNTLPKTVLQGTLEGGRRRGRQTKSWMDNIKEWTHLDSPTLIRKAEDRAGWRRLAAESSLMSPPRPFRS